MRKPTKAERIDAARAAHYRREFEMFHLKPWETPPVWAHLSDPPDPTDTSGGALSWPRARQLRDELLKANPHHYDDLKG